VVETGISAPAAALSLNLTAREVSNIVAPLAVDYVV